MSEKTAQRWKNATTCPPESALMLLRGDLECFDPKWSGWVCRRGLLISPEGWQITRHDVLATPLMRSQIAIYQSENRALKAQVAYLDLTSIEEQPLPEEWDVQIIMA
ncbi:MAG TPA: DUF3653 domain-containing protein [Nitrospiraceae bacterium]|nr:DUF3653 domain-containing protein [Nitrospiraceae bacterium]